MFNFYLLIIKSENKSSMKYYFSWNSCIKKVIADIFFNDCDVTNIFDNDRSVIISRIDNVKEVWAT